MSCGWKFWRKCGNGWKLEPQPTSRFRGLKSLKSFFGHENLQKLERFKV
jgi:hypothetical protein